MDVFVVLLIYSLMPTLHVISVEWSGNEFDVLLVHFSLFVFMAQKPMAAKNNNKKSETDIMTYNSGVFHFNTTTTSACYPSQGMGRKR